MINTTQSTSDIIASKRLREQYAAMAPQRTAVGTVDLQAANPLGMLTQGLTTATNALTDPSRRAEEQANAERAEALRMEQQTYERNRAAEKDKIAAEERKYLREQDEKRNTLAERRFGLELEDRRAQIAQQKAEVSAAANLGAIGAKEAADIGAIYSSHGLNPNSGEIGLINELAQYDTIKAEGGPSTWENMMPAGFADVYLKNSDIRDNIMDDLDDAINGGSVGKGAKQLAGKAWSPEYEQFAIAKLMQRVQLSPGFLGLGAGNFDEEGAATFLANEMANIAKVKGIVSEVESVKKGYAAQRAAEQLRVAEAGLRTK